MSFKRNFVPDKTWQNSVPVTDTTGRPAGEGADGLLGGGTHRVVLGGLGQLLRQSERGRQLLGPQPVVGEERVDEVERLDGGDMVGVLGLQLDDGEDGLEVDLLAQDLGA